MEVHSAGAEDTGFSKANQTLHFTDISIMYRYNPYSVESHYYHPTTISEHNKIVPLFLEKWHNDAQTEKLWPKAMETSENKTSCVFSPT
jgi:hypothetical protein